MDLLSKLTRKLCIGHNALCVKCLKAKYVKQLDILNAQKLGKSQAWHGIWLSKKVICKGFVWTMGLEVRNSISALKDKWLPKVIGFTQKMKKEVIVDQN